MSSASPVCPVCKESSVFVSDLPKEEIQTVLSGLFGADMPPNLPIADYTLQECTGCSLVFANPMQAGNDEFYGWITSFDRYKSEGRWEWKVIKEQLVRRKAKTLFEIGAGTGKLMTFLSSIDGLKCSGIDLSPTSCAAAQAKGFDVRNVAFDDLGQVLEPTDTFDVIILSHVLEHVDNPLGIMQTLLGRISKGGHIMVAVPYSPMSRELTGWDIMNLPPHHLTRWNAQSLQKLADTIGCQVELETSKAKSPFRRAMQDVCGDVLGDKHPSTLKRISTVLGNFSLFKEFLARHRAREQLDGRLVGESVLAIFSIKK